MSKSLQGQCLFLTFPSLRIAGVSKARHTSSALPGSDISRELCNAISSLSKIKSNPHQSAVPSDMRPPPFLQIARGQMPLLSYRGFLSCFKVSVQLPHTGIYTCIMLISVVYRYRITESTRPTRGSHVIQSLFHVVPYKEEPIPLP